MKPGWEEKRFEDCLEKVVYTKKVKRKDFLDKGDYPIISQEQNFINGFWNNSSDLFVLKKPIIIFGDHTKVIKYIDFNFVLGADGVKILQPIDKLFPKYFFYFLQSVKFKNLGYARHYRLLKDLFIPLPPLPEQRRIVAILDQAFAAIAKANENTEKNIQNTQEFFESYLNNVFENIGEFIEYKPIGDIFETGAGGTPLKSHEEYYKDGDIPWIRSGEVCTKNINISELYITKKGLKNSSAKIFPINTVLVAMYGATAGQIGILKINSATNQAICGIFPNNQFLPEFVFYYLTAKKRILINQAVGNAQPNISQEKIKKMKLPILPIQIQEEMVNKLNTISIQTQKIEKVYFQKLKELDEFKKSLLQKAFAGELSKD